MSCWVMKTSKNYSRSQSIEWMKHSLLELDEKDAVERSISLRPLTIDNRSPYDYARQKYNMISVGYFMHLQVERRHQQDIEFPAHAIAYFLSWDTNQSLHCWLMQQIFCNRNSNDYQFTSPIASDSRRRSIYLQLQFRRSAISCCSYKWRLTVN